MYHSWYWTWTLTIIPWDNVVALASCNIGEKPSSLPTPPHAFARYSPGARPSVLLICVLPFSWEIDATKSSLMFLLTGFTEISRLIDRCDTRLSGLLAMNFGRLRAVITHHHSPLSSWRHGDVDSVITVRASLGLYPSVAPVWA